MKHGSTLEDALTRVPSMVTTNIPCQDHLGNQYISQAEMARAYGLTKEQFIARKRNGWDIERILTTPISGDRNSNSFELNGVSYSSKKEFCEKNGLNYDTFIHRTNAGMSIEEALAAASVEKPSRSAAVIDHKGNSFSTIKEMCAHYGVAVRTYKYRLAQGWGLEAALTKSIDTTSIVQKNVIDYKGVQYKSIAEMCSAYGLRVATYKYRIAHGWDMEQALTTPLNSKPFLLPKKRKLLHFDATLSTESLLMSTMQNIVAAYKESYTEEGIDPVISDPSEKIEDNDLLAGYSPDDFKAFVEKLVEHLELLDNEGTDNDVWRTILGERFPAGSSKHALADFNQQTCLDAPHRQKLPYPYQGGSSVFISAKVRTASGEEIDYQSNGEPLAKNCSLVFTAITGAKHRYQIKWQVVNTGAEATTARGLRGGFEDSDIGLNKKKESTYYTGCHSVQCFVIYKGACLAKSRLFIVNII